MKCKRCNTGLNSAVKGWAKCPKCGLAKFVGKKSKKADSGKKDGAGKADSPTEKGGEDAGTGIEGRGEPAE